MFLTNRITEKWNIITRILKQRLSTVVKLKLKLERVVFKAYILLTVKIFPITSLKLYCPVNTLSLFYCCSRNKTNITS
jgi:hypothetical protein